MEALASADARALLVPEYHAAPGQRAQDEERDGRDEGVQAHGRPPSSATTSRSGGRPWAFRRRAGAYCSHPSR